MKTEYRIISVHGYLGRTRFLQFKTTATRRRRSSPFWRFWNKTYEVYTEEQWRFIPEATHPRVNGKYLTPELCPTETKRLHHFLSCFFGHEAYSRPTGIIWFAEQYPDIQKYFDELLLQRIRYVEEQHEEANAKTVYL